MRQDYHYCCVVCSDTLTVDERATRAADVLARKVYGWSRSKYGWLCNWHRGNFANNAANLMASALEMHSDLRPRREYPIYGEEITWALDFAFIKERLAIEVEGGVWTHGRHTRGSGFIRDIEKYNALTMAGWRLLRYTPQMIEDDPLKVISEIRHVLE